MDENSNGNLESEAPVDWSTRLGVVRRSVERSLVRPGHPYPDVTLFFSVADGDARAHVINVSGHSFDKAWQRGLVELHAATRDRRINGKWLRIDWVEGVEELTWNALRERLRDTKRNYFRHGLALDPELRTAFLEQELNGNAMLYGGNKIAHATVNEKNFSIYARNRFGGDLQIDFSDENRVFILSTRGVFYDADADAVHELDGPGASAGRRSLEQLTGDDVYSLVQSASSFLTHQVKKDGSFLYGYHPCFDRVIQTYNTLRHASTTYAMIEAWEVTRDPALKVGIDRSIDHLTNKLIRTMILPDKTPAAFLVDVSDEIKLGGNAVAILALTKYSETTGTRRFLPLLEKLALGIQFMQEAHSGAFTHVLNAHDLSVKAPYRTIYYEGEAAFGLMRLYNLTRDPRWLDIVEKAFEHFIAQKHWQHHDHWLSYCVNELTRYRPDEHYFRFGIQNVAGYLDFVLERVTTFPTLLELMMAAREMIARIDDLPQFHHLLAEIDLRKFQKALEYRSHYLLNGHFWPEIAMFFRNPGRIVGSFFIRHHAFRVRIDDVEHYLSGFVAYRKYLGDRRAFDELILRHSRRTVEPREHRPDDASQLAIGWTAHHVEKATGGKWVTMPPPGWMASGICYYPPVFQPGNMAVIRTGDDRLGMVPKLVGRMKPRPQAIVTRNPDQLENPAGIPVLQVGNTGDAVLAMGRYARARMTGRIFGVTGSAGKTTVVAMLAHALSGYGAVGQSTQSANLPRGVAWNLAAIPWNVPYAVMELAIGRMEQSSRIACPHIAIFTNILPAHLVYHGTLAQVASKKAAIFLGMREGDVAVLNRDMAEWSAVAAKAQDRKLKVINYGTHPESDFQLIDYAHDGNQITALAMGREIRFRPGAPGLHMAMNSLAVLAAVHAAGQEIDSAIEKLGSFSALAGRGEEFEVKLGERRLTVLDDAYNANPGSMRAALDRLSQCTTTGRRIAVLGQMEELGPDAVSYHTELADFVRDRSIDKIYVTGVLYADFWDRLQVSQQGRRADSLDKLKEALHRELAANDTVLFKGSNSTRIHELVNWVKNDQALPAREISSHPASRIPRVDGADKAPLDAALECAPHMSVLLHEDESDRMVFARGEMTSHPPASITKMLTLCLIEDRLKDIGATSDKLIRISESAADVNSWWGFAAGEQVKIGALMQACATVSSNEAANALAEWHSGSLQTFTSRLNQRATELGMLDTQFASPSGLSQPQKITAMDALLLARYVYAQYPAIAALCARRSFVWKGKRYPGTNRLLDIEGADGLKTGTLGARRHHIVFSALRGEKRWTAVVLSAPTKPQRDEVVRLLAKAYIRQEA